VSCDLTWPLPAAPSLNTVAGHVWLSLKDGSTVPASIPGTPFPLLSVPALVAAGGADTQGPPAALRFRELSGDFELDHGQARTTDLHFDGDAEILVRGRLGLLARDYDQQVWILRGQERLPAALRRLGPTPRVAAMWLSFRELLAPSRERGRAWLHLQGSWDDPIVAPDRP
jgi:uncharacterized protein YhdP